MSTFTDSPEQNLPFMLLFRGHDWDRGKSREETERIMASVGAWFESLQKQGVVRGGHPLAREGKFVSGQERTVADGPFAESKEVVGGYLVVEVDRLETATEIARQCPTLDHGIVIEVRPMLCECPITKRLREQQLVTA